MTLTEDQVSFVREQTYLLVKKVGLACRYRDQHDLGSPNADRGALQRFAAAITGFTVSVLS